MKFVPQVKYHEAFYDKMRFRSATSIEGKCWMHDYMEETGSYDSWLVGALRQCSYQRWWLSEWVTPGGTAIPGMTSLKDGDLQYSSALAQSSKGGMEPNHPLEINPNSDSRSRSDGRSRRYCNTAGRPVSMIETKITSLFIPRCQTVIFFNNSKNYTIVSGSLVEKLITAV